ncbi:MAG: plasmid replication initiator TrfA [Gammaproteobacteria bacterium]
MTNTRVMDRLQRALDKLGNSLAARAARRAAEVRPTADAAPPACANSSKPTPLFTREAPEQRPYLEGVPLALRDGGVVAYRGPVLAADDQAVWSALLLLDRSAQQPEWVEFSPAAFLKLLGWGVNRHSCARLRACLERMQATALRIPGSDRAQGQCLPLIIGFAWQDTGVRVAGRWRVRIDAAVRALFDDAAQRRDASVQRLARQLRLLYVGYEQPYPRRVDTLRQQFAPTCPDDEFRAQLEIALGILVNAGFLQNYRIDERDLVAVNKTQRHDA